MTNQGIAPPDFNTEVGKLRALIGDTRYIELDPPVTGQGDYRLFSDAELEAYVAANDSLLRAASSAYFALAAQAALEAKSVKDYDLSVDLTKRSQELRAIADGFATRADEEDAGSEDAFWLVPTGDGCPYVHPEAAPWPVRRWC